MKLITIINSSTLFLPYLINMHIQKVLMERILGRPTQCSLFWFSFILDYIPITKDILSTLLPYEIMRSQRSHKCVFYQTFNNLVTFLVWKIPHFLIFNVPKIINHHKNPLQPRCFTSSNIYYAP